MVISLKVAAEKENEYRRWQEKVTDLARGFAGFEDSELHPPADGEGDVWVVVYRFSDIDRLTAWLDSDVRRGMLEQGGHLFDAPPRQEVMAGEAPTRDIVTAVISHEVLPGKEQDFARWQAKVRKAQEGFPGFMGFELFEPVPGVQDRWVAAVRFDTREHLDRWLESEERASLLKEGRSTFADYDVQKVRSAFSGWFRFDDEESSGVPPNWKQAMSVLLALYPTVMILNLTAGKLFQKAGIPDYLSLFLSNVLSISVLTWFAMPLVNRVFAAWLTARPGSPAPRRFGTAAIILCYLVLIAIFALITR
ncbi:antibiotic biosynthesis monooxygenase [Actinocorallia herbida]|uniref:antibiotic biosynthesis monooxygenase n=1 Tax=Actinocorallia herbida TaxID=58109 RepID=UPI000F4B25E4|nr:antibiotic biosynthesis monooxygenase [Actinocorallia herbida]